MIKPIKTEYKQIVFDSKSEAVFARTLHLVNIAWHYQPGCHNGQLITGFHNHPWDFCLFQIGWRPLILIEYKPSMPTRTYLENLTKKVRTNPKETFVIWGNPWEDTQPEINVYSGRKCCYRVYPIFSSYTEYSNKGRFFRLDDKYFPVSNEHNIFDMFGITEEIVQEAKEYRFDLA